MKETYLETEEKKKKIKEMLYLCKRKNILQGSQNAWETRKIYIKSIYLYYMALHTKFSDITYYVQYIVPHQQCA